MTTPRILILCGRSARHLFVANTLCHAAEVLAIIQEDGTDWRVASVLRKLRPTALMRKAWRWLRDRRRYTGNPEARYFFPDRAAALDRPDLVHVAPHINHPEVLRLTRSLQPDLICVFGTSLLRGELLREGRLGILNLHGGLSPEYRGADCTFWALYNGEPDKVGCTLHYIDAGIDTGRLIAHICPAVRSGDTELELFWRAVHDSAAVYAEAIVRIANAEPLGVGQTGRGHLYQVRDRGLRHERDLAARLPHLLDGVDLPPRVRWLMQDS